MKYIKAFEAINPRITRNGKKPSPFKILVKYEHGDADLTTKESFNFSNEEDFKKVLKFFYECMNFVPNTAYGKLGHFQPIPDEANSGGDEEDVWNRLIDIGEKYDINEDALHEYIISDNKYDQGFASLDGIKVKVNNEDLVIVFMDALETNKIDLPNIGDIIKINANHISGYGKDLFGGKSIDYLPNSGSKDYISKSFDAKVLDCSINFMHKYDNEYYTSYESFHYVLLLEATQDVLKNDVRHYNGTQPRKISYQMQGWDPEFETKFNKDKYDGMNYYEVKL